LREQKNFMAVTLNAEKARKERPVIGGTSIPFSGENLLVFDLLKRIYRNHDLAVRTFQKFSALPAREKQAILGIGEHAFNNLRYEKITNLRHLNLEQLATIPASDLKHVARLPVDELQLFSKEKDTTRIVKRARELVRA